MLVRRRDPVPELGLRRMGRKDGGGALEGGRPVVGGSRSARQTRRDDACNAASALLDESLLFLLDGDHGPDLLGGIGVVALAGHTEANDDGRYRGRASRVCWCTNVGVEGARLWCAAHGDPPSF